MNSRVDGRLQATLIGALAVLGGCQQKVQTVSGITDDRVQLVQFDHPIIQELLPTLPAHSDEPLIPGTSRAYVIHDESQLACDGFIYKLVVDDSAGEAWIQRSGGFAGQIVWFGPTASDQPHVQYFLQEDGRHQSVTP